MSMPQLIRLGFILAAGRGQSRSPRSGYVGNGDWPGWPGWPSPPRWRSCVRSAPGSDRIRCAIRYSSATEEAQIGGDLIEVVDTPFG